MKHIRAAAISTLAACFLVVLSHSANGGQSKHDLTYLKDNFSELYNQNHELFWDILNNGAENAKKCSSPTYTRDFLDLVRFFRGSAELGEFFGETVERLCVSNPKCFFDSLIKLNNEAKYKVIDMLLYPVTLQEAQVQGIFEKYKNVEKYRDDIEFFLMLSRYTGNQDSNFSKALEKLEKGEKIFRQKVDLEKEKKAQAEVDKGRQTWRLEPIVVAYVAVKTDVDKYVFYQSCSQFYGTEKETEVRCAARRNYVVHLKKLIRFDGIWTATSIEIEP